MLAEVRGAAAKVLGARVLFAQVIACADRPRHAALLERQLDLPTDDNYIAPS
jgi:hypothetical protein